jgi:hypothetical protein
MSAEELQRLHRTLLAILFVILISLAGWKIDDKLTQILHAIQTCATEPKK